MATPNKTAVLDWIRKLADAKETTTLVLRRGERWGWIGFRDGEITSIRTEETRGMDALNILVLWWDAELYADTTVEEEKDPAPLPLDTEGLCTASEGFVSEVAELAGDLDILQAYAQKTDFGKEAREELDVEVAAVLDLFDGKMALVELLEVSPYNILWTLRAVAALLEQEAIEPAAN